VLAVMRTRLALIACLPIATGLALAAGARQPDILVGAAGHAVLTLSGQGIGALAAPRDAFVVRQWLQAAGDGREPADPTLKSAARCDPEGCTLPIGEGRVLALDRTLNAAEEDCGRVSLLVTPLDLPAFCARRHGLGAASPNLALGRREIIDASGFALTLDQHPDGTVTWRMEPALPDTRRPWNPPLLRTPQPAVSPPAAHPYLLGDQDQ
jgi:competence protein ComEC